MDVGCVVRDGDGLLWFMYLFLCGLSLFSRWDTAKQQKWEARDPGSNPEYVNIIPKTAKR